MMTVEQETHLQSTGVSSKRPSAQSASGAGMARTSDPSFNHQMPEIAADAERTSDCHPTLADALAQLEQLDLPALQEKWLETYGKAASGRFGAEFLKRAIGYQLQEQALGGLSRQAELRLDAWGYRGKPNTPASLPSSSAVKPGTRFVREWQNVTHEVLALEGESFVYRNKTYRSLTEIAQLITGTHQSGPRFFGIGKYAPKRGQTRSEEKEHG